MKWNGMDGRHFAGLGEVITKWFLLKRERGVLDVEI